MTDEERAKAWFDLCDNGNGVVVPMPMNIAQLAREFASVREEAYAQGHKDGHSCGENDAEIAYNAMLEPTWARDT